MDDRCTLRSDRCLVCNSNSKDERTVSNCLEWTTTMKEDMTVVCQLLHLDPEPIRNDPLCRKCFKLIWDLARLREVLLQNETKIRAKIRDLQEIVVRNFCREQKASNPVSTNLFQKHFLDEHRNGELLRKAIRNHHRQAVVTEPSLVQIHLEVLTTPNGAGLPSFAKIGHKEGHLNEIDELERKIECDDSEATKDLVPENRTTAEYFSKEVEPYPCSSDKELDKHQKNLKCKVFDEEKLRHTNVSCRRRLRRRRIPDSQRESSTQGRNRGKKYSKIETRDDGRLIFKGVEIVSTHISPDQSDCVACGSCGMEFTECTARAKSRYEKIKHHIYKAHLKAFRCEPCNKDFSSPRNLRVHMKSRSHLPKNPMGYDKCPQLISKGEDGNMYYGSYQIFKTDLENGYEVGCTVCGHVVSSADAKRSRSCPYKVLVHHIDVLHKEIYRCHICGKNYTCSRNLENHFLFRHTANPPKMKCDICGKPLQSSNILRKHKWTHKNKEERIAAIEGGETPPINYKEFLRRRHENGIVLGYQCFRCGKTFDLLSGLRRHETIHALKSYKCSWCEKMFPSVKRLNTHKKFVHSSVGIQKNYHCKVCSKEFVKYGTFVKHEQKHTRTMPFSCQSCSRGFSLKVSQVRHEKKYHQDATLGNPDGKTPTRNRKEATSRRNFNCAITESSIQMNSLLQDGSRHIFVHNAEETEIDSGVIVASRT